MTEYEQEIELIKEMGLKSSPLRLEYEEKVHALRNLPENLKAKGYSEEQIARIMYEERRELGRGSGSDPARHRRKRAAKLI